MLKKLAAFSFALVICFSCITITNAAEKYTKDEIAGIIDGIISYKENKLGVSTVNDLVNSLSQSADSYETQWYIIALSKYGVNFCVPSVQGSMNKSALKLYEGNSKATDFQRTVLALYSCGLDPQNISGKNILADAVCNSTLVENQGINAYAYALIALDCAGAEISVSAKYSRDFFVDKILSLQLSDGGFALSGTRADPDVTAMCLQALSLYVSKDSVNTAVNRALSCLSSMQKENGGFSSYGTENAESSAQVISALVSLGIDPAADSRFIKNGSSVFDALMTFLKSDGGFAHISGGKSNALATYQSLNALADYYSYISEGNTDIFSLEENKNYDSSSKTYSNGNSNNPGNTFDGNETQDTDNNGFTISEDNTAANQNQNTQSEQTATDADESAFANRSISQTQTSDACGDSTPDGALLSEKSGKLSRIPADDFADNPSGSDILNAGILQYTSGAALALIAGYLILYKVKFLGKYGKIQSAGEDNESES